MDANGQNLTFSAGHITPQLQDVPCTLHRLSGPLDGKITFMIASHDGKTTWEGAQVYQFEVRPVDNKHTTLMDHTAPTSVAQTHTVFVCSRPQKLENTTTTVSWQTGCPQTMENNQTF